MPLTPPLSTHNIHTAAANSTAIFEHQPESAIVSQDYVEDNKTGETGDLTRQEAGTHNSYNVVPPSEPTEATQIHLRQEPQESVVGLAASSNTDYFASQPPPQSQATDFAINVLPRSGDENTSKDSSMPASPESYQVNWRDFSSHQGGSVITSSSPRPTSVPNFQSSSLSRRREGPDYPNYPDQSFRALQDQESHLTHRPVSPRPLRTRSSQSSHFSPSDSQYSTDLPRNPSGAKSLGNTPAQSPGLFSSASTRKRPWPSENDEGRSNTPMLHPTHQKPPKEFV